jgi:hypothetical protein
LCLHVGILLQPKIRRTIRQQRTNTVDLVFWILQAGGGFNRLILFSGAVYYENVSETPILLTLQSLVVTMYAVYIYIQGFCILSTQDICFICLPQLLLISVNNINGLLYVLQELCVFCAVPTELLCLLNKANARNLLNVIV